MNYNELYAKPGKAYRNVNPCSHYNEPIDNSPGRLTGNSRKWGDASQEVQRGVIDAIVAGGQASGLTERQIAYVLAMAYVESGFNPDAAAGTTSASGLGQFIDRTGAYFGLSAINRFDAIANANALVRYFLYNEQIANKRGQGEEYIYKYHHDGPTRDYGGLDISRNIVMPLVDKFQGALHANEDPRATGPDYVGPSEDDSCFLPGAMCRLEDDPNGECNPDPMPPLQQRFEQDMRMRRADPLVLDLDGDGVETLAVTAGAYFDHAGDGFAERTGWAGPHDGLLVLDRNGNGVIDNGGELFGDNTLLATGRKAPNGFEALKELDANHDGRIDANDPAYALLRAWKDADGDGFSLPEELLPLAEAGVGSINLSYTDFSKLDPNNIDHRVVGSYTTTSGQTRTATDLWLPVNTSQSIPLEWEEEPGDIAGLPDLRGYGTTPSLHQAM